MDLDPFRSAANRVRAEQFLQEKQASARLDAVSVAHLARTSQLMQADGVKLAAERGTFWHDTAAPIALGVLPAVAGSLAALATMGQLGRPARIAAAAGGAVAAAGAVGAGYALMKKTAEPPPPKGMSSKAWDKILSKGPPKG